MVKNAKDLLHVTDRLQEYLSLVALGYTNIQISGILSVGSYTPKKTFEEAYRKLNAKNRANATAIALINGIITVEYLNKMDERAKAFLKANPKYLKNKKDY